MVRIPTEREPTHPGEMLLEEFLIPAGLTQRELADAIHAQQEEGAALADIQTHHIVANKSV